MANHKSAEKAHRRSLRNKARNQSILSRIKTAIKKFETALAGAAADIQSLFRSAESEITKGVSKGVMHKNTASRKVSRLTKKMKVSQ